MAKRYGHVAGAEYDANGIQIVRSPRKGRKKEQGYDFIDPQSARIAKAAGGKVLDGLAFLIAGPKKK